MEVSKRDKASRYQYENRTWQVMNDKPVGINKNMLGITHKPERYYASRRADMLPFVPSSVKKLLDVGCGEGEFGALLKSLRDIEVWGVEICDEAAEKAEIKLDSVVRTDIERDDVNIPSDYFDCVVFNDVLEHLYDPWKVLRDIRRYLRTDGYVVVSVPNIRYYENMKRLILHKEWEYVDSGILDISHLRFFTMKSLKEMFEISDYNIIQLRGLWGGPIPWTFRILNRLMLRVMDDMKFYRLACVAQKSNI